MKNKRYTKIKYGKYTYVVYCMCKFIYSISSIIQTVLSVLEFHQICLRSRTLTAGREFHPAPKIIKFIIYTLIINLSLYIVKWKGLTLKKRWE